MPMQRKLYPDDWEEIAHQIKTAANYHCTECGRTCRLPGESKDEFFARARLPPDVAIGKYTLTVAHLNHQPSDNRPDNLRALCAVCHLRYDSKQMSRKRYLKRERLGQQTLFG